MIHSVKGIILHRREITESSLILTAFTDRAGKLSLLAKGARRRRSPFLGRVELFTRCALTYYDSPRRGLNILSECDPIDAFAPLRTDLSRFALACCFAELVEMGTGLAAKSAGVFELLGEALSAACAGAVPGLVRSCFEIRLLSLLGYSLRLDACASCHSGTGVQRTFSAAAGGVVCARCAPQFRDGLGVTPGTVAFLRRLRAIRPNAEFRVKPDARQAAEASEMLRRAIVFYLDAQPRTVRLLASLPAHECGRSA
ncbi:MAG: DNA repair protein RecO [Chlamydiota bacterium]